jgi:hypothetical protein
MAVSILELVIIKKDEQITKQELLGILGRFKIDLPNCFALMAQDTMKTFCRKYTSTCSLA